MTQPDIRKSIARFLLSALVTLAVGAGFPTPSPAQEARRTEASYGIDTATLVAAESSPNDWLSYGRTYKEQRFSPLAQINKQTVADLGIAWMHTIGSKRGVQTTPLIVDGVMYATGAWSTVFALDVSTGEPLWDYDPQVPRQTAIKLCCGISNRGAALYQGRIFSGTLDGRLIALDADTGEQLWQTQTVDPEQPYSITGAPRIVKGNVVIGNGGAEFGVRGYISAYSSETGELVWRFYTVPGNPADGFENDVLKLAAETWTGSWWELGGGGTVWDSFVYDPELDLLYIGVGNGSPWNREHRSPGGGDNLFLSSIVALRPDTGEYVWHYQTTPGDTWDFTATQHIMLAELAIGGRVRKVLMQAPKNGFFYLLDRATGELLSAEKFVPTTWASHVDMATGRPVELPGVRYEEKPSVITPTAGGAHNWHPMSFSPEHGLVYIPTREATTIYAQADVYERETGVWRTGTGSSAISPIAFLSLPEPTGYLLAWDPVRQEERWRSDHEGADSGGTLATAGDLVFQGTPAGFLNAFDAGTGAQLWQHYVGAMVAPPITFAVGGKQYLTVVSGLGGLASNRSRPPGSPESRSRVIAFSLGAKGKALEQAPSRMPRVSAIDSSATADQINAGARTFNQYCGSCHRGESDGNIIADLRISSAQVFDRYQDIVLGGARLDRGMPSFKDYLSPQDVANIRAYILQARRLLVSMQGAADGL